MPGTAGFLTDASPSLGACNDVGKGCEGMTAGRQGEQLQRKVRSGVHRPGRVAGAGSADARGPGGRRDPGAPAGPAPPSPGGASRPHTRPLVRVMTVRPARSRLRGSSRGSSGLPHVPDELERGRGVRGGEIPSDLTFLARRRRPASSRRGAAGGSVNC